MCLCVVISDSMVFHCNFILGSVCHGSGRHHLSGPSDLSLICIGHRTMALLLIELFLHLIFRVFLSQQTTVRAVTIHLSPPARCYKGSVVYPTNEESFPPFRLDKFSSYCIYTVYMVTALLTQPLSFFETQKLILVVFIFILEKSSI